MWFRFLALGAVIGPGIISASADNDAGGITTYSIVGAHFGTSMLWVLFLITFALAVTQEMGARIGMVTRQGLAGIIRENFGVRWTALVMLALVIANFGTTVAEFAGVAASFSLWGVNKYIAVPIIAALVWVVLFKGSFRTTQRIFLLFSFFYVIYIINAFIIGPDFGAALRDTLRPTVGWSTPYLITLIALIGTTITPWGQFFIQSYVVDKGLDEQDCRTEKGEIYLGAVLTNLISFFIIISTAATLFPAGIEITSAHDAALALRPLAGQLAGVLFAAGLFAASMLGAFILPVATAYALCEAFGWETGFDTTWKNGRIFYSIILFFIVVPSALVLVPGISLIKLMLFSQDINGILLPFILVFVIKIVNNRRLMGTYTNTLAGNIISWATIAVLIVATVALVGASVIGYS